MTNQYRRYFINLYQEDICCTIKNKEAVGRCRIETKSNTGRIYIWVQNLCQGSYDIYLISAKKIDNQEQKYILKDISIGRIIADSHGYAEINRDFDPNKIFDTELLIDDINIIAITPKDNKNIVALCGYKNSKIQWREAFENNNIDHKNNSDIKKSEPDSHTKSEAQIKTENKMKLEVIKETMKKIEKTKEINQNQIENKSEKSKTKEIDKTQKINIDKIKDNLESETEKEDRNKENKNIEIKPDNYKFITEKEIDEFISQKNNQEKKLDSKKTILDFMFENNIPMTPFEKQNKNINWIRISLREIINLPLDYYLYTNNPFVLVAYYKNKHLILGKNYQENNYILGLPDRYQPEYKVMLSKLNFVQFKCCQDKKPIREDYGYWLMPIDF